MTSIGDQNKSRKGMSGFMKAVGRAFGLRKSSKTQANADGNNMTHEQQQQYQQQQQYHQQQQQEQGYPQQGFSPNQEGYQQQQQQQQQPGHNPGSDVGTVEPRQRSFSSTSSQQQRQLQQQQQQQQQIMTSLPASIHFKSFPNAGSLGVKL